MKFTLSTNIEAAPSKDFNYIVTSNAQRVLGSLVSDYISGIHSFTIIGTYGTGKSSFLLALERDLLFQTSHLFQNNGQFDGFKRFRCENIVGDYAPLVNVLSRKLGKSDISNPKEVFKLLDETINDCKRNDELLVIVIDEFGKILEHAANHNPEKELYFLQQLAEYVNNPSRHILLITTLHQNFGAYAKKLTEQQKNEWIKVKGRFKELVFSEPVEQLLYLAAEQISREDKALVDPEAFSELFLLSQETKIIYEGFKIETAKKLYPIDMFAAVALTLSIQRYGQNERTLFSFLFSRGKNSINEFEPSKTKTYNLANVYDYIVYNFYSFLSEVNSDSMNWTAMRVALERVEGSFNIDEIQNASMLVKAIGLLNLFGSSSIKVDHDSLCTYARLAMNIPHPENVIKNLVSFKIIRFATYKSQYVLFEGTDINIEDELYKAAGQIPKPVDFINELNSLFEFRIIPANASYYRTGTPRFFEYHLTTDAITNAPTGDIDGYINLIFPRSDTYRSSLVELSKNCPHAIIFVYFKNIEAIVNYLYEIQKMQYVLDVVLIDKSDKIAIREINNLIAYEKNLLNKAINDSLSTYSDEIEWYYKGVLLNISNHSDFNKLLSSVCDDVYYSTPLISNELFNKQKINSSISLARVNYMQALVDYANEKDLGFSNDRFPPEKTIYSSLLLQTGIHREDENAGYVLGEPLSDQLNDLWNVCEDFLQSTTDKKRKLGELIKNLKVAPFKLKQGFIDFWIPTYLIIKKQDFSLYNGDDVYIPNINKEVLEILQKSPGDFRIKAFSVDGVKVDFFNKYRNFINLHDKELITSESFIETIKPFLAFYKRLNDYTKNTYKFDNSNTAKFRDVLAKAKDPEKTFFEELPNALGFKNESLIANDEFMKQYQDLISNAIRDLRTCYTDLIDRIEDIVILNLGLNSDSFSSYKLEIENRFSSLKQHLLTTKQRNFLNRVLFPQTDKTVWFESICFVVLDKPLTSLKDNEEELLIDNILYLFRELTKYIDISAVARLDSKDQIYKFELVSTEGTVSPQAFILPESYKSLTDDIEEKINSILSGNDNLDVCTLLRILKKKTSK